MKSIFVPLIFLSGLAHANPNNDEAQVKEELPAQNMLLGALDKAEIDKVVSANKGRIQGCFEQGLKQDPDISGRVELKFIIGPSGSVNKTEVTETTLNHAATEKCMVDVTNSMIFPEPEGGGVVIVVYPFALSS